MIVRNSYCVCNIIITGKIYKMFVGNCTCTDPSGNCIMMAKLSLVLIPPMQWSSCSEIEFFNSIFTFGCINNHPYILSIAEPVCGNGIVEDGEECDCNGPEVSIKQTVSRCLHEVLVFCLV